MAGRRKSASTKKGATLGFEQTVWQAADKLRNNMDAAEYKHVLGLIFLTYIEAHSGKLGATHLWN